MDDSRSHKVGIVVLNFNGKDCLLRCLQSLKKQTYQHAFIILVDNDSRDGSLSLAQENFPEFTYITRGENGGFAKGMNEGIRQALQMGAEWVWLFNNDAEAKEDALQVLIQAASSEESIGALSPLIIDSKTQKVWFGGGRVDFLRMRAAHLPVRPSKLTEKFYESEFLTGCALLLSSKALQTIGLFDERFFLYYEDVDLSLRLREAKMKCVVVPGARVSHSERSRLNSEKLYFLVLSGLIFFKKHTPLGLRLYMALYATIRRIKNKIDILRGRDEARIVRRAYDDFYHGK